SEESAAARETCKCPFAIEPHGPLFDPVEQLLRFFQLAARDRCLGMGREPYVLRRFLDPLRPSVGRYRPKMVERRALSLQGELERAKRKRPEQDGAKVGSRVEGGSLVDRAPRLLFVSEMGEEHRATTQAGGDDRLVLGLGAKLAEHVRELEGSRPLVGEPIERRGIP